MMPKHGGRLRSWSGAAAIAAGLAAGLAGAGTALAQEDRVGVASDWQLWHQPAATTQMAQMDSFHQLVFVLSFLITAFVLGLLLYVIVRFNAKRNPTPNRTTHNTLVEVLWTIVPVLILLLIAVPSFRLLYYLDRTENPEMTLVATGYQWYWGYEYPDQQIAEFPSYLLAREQEDVPEGKIRLLSTDAPVVLPVDTDIQILITAAPDGVLHAWTIPAFGIKQDAVPGRVNEAWIRIEQEGVYYGQCSELCGVDHGYMPIEVHAVSRAEFNDWVRQQTAGLALETPPVMLTLSDDEAAAGQLAQTAP